MAVLETCSDVKDPANKVGVIAIVECVFNVYLDMRSL